MLNRLGRLTKIKQDQSGLEVPSGQFVTEKFPVLTFGPTPKIDLATWKFSITGLVDEEKMLDWEEFNSLPKVTLDAEFHCVTQWSRLQNTWEGVLFTDMMKLANVKPEATHVMAHCYGGYSTNVALDVLMDDDVLFAQKHDGETLTPEARHPETLRLEERQVGQWCRVHARRHARVLGDQRLSYERRPVERRTFLGSFGLTCCPTISALDKKGSPLM